MRIIVRAKCENCEFVRTGVEIKGKKFTNNAGLSTHKHLQKHPDHVIELSIGKLNGKYIIKNNQFELIE